MVTLASDRDFYPIHLHPTAGIMERRVDEPIRLVNATPKDACKTLCKELYLENSGDDIRCC